MQQIGDRKRALADWQARLEAHGRGPGGPQGRLRGRSRTVLIIMRWQTFAAGSRLVRGAASWSKPRHVVSQAHVFDAKV